tara:strand:+ start:132 stop:335 length:204 start_codon:yes stop_codon:yes gene_type:complete
LTGFSKQPSPNPPELKTSTPFILILRKPFDSEENIIGCENSDSIYPSQTTSNGTYSRNGDGLSPTGI